MSVEEKTCSFAVGDIFVCYPHRAGASKYPVFGKVTKITPAGKYRITFLQKLYPESEKNSSGLWGSYKVVKPDLNNLLGESVLTKWDPNYPTRLYAGERNMYFCWDIYIPSQEYMDHHDNGD